MNPLHYSQQTTDGADSRDEGLLPLIRKNSISSPSSPRTLSELNPKFESPLQRYPGNVLVVYGHLVDPF